MKPLPTLSLEDIVLPPAVGWWPPAAGWWLVSAGALAVLAAAGLAWRWRRRTRLRRLAIRRLDVLRAEWRAHGDAHALASGLSVLCRQILLVCHPGRAQAALTGESLLCALDAAGGRESFFAQGVGRVLASAPYVQNPAFDADALLRGVAAWLQKLPPHPARLRLHDV